MDPHPVDEYSDEALHDLMMRVDDRGFPGDLEELWRIEQERYRETLKRIPPAANHQSALLDLGSSRPWLPYWQVLLGYRNIVLNAAYKDAHFVEDGLTVRDAPCAEVRMSVFNIEIDPFPFEDESFDVVVCLEVLEHLAIDPMAMMAEANRVLKPGGALVLSTPNAVSYRNVVDSILGEHPGWSPYNGYDTNRHNREYTADEIRRLFQAGGITPDEVTTFGSKRRSPKRQILQHATALALRAVPGCPPKWRKDVVLAHGTKTSTEIQRRPEWLYFDLGERQ